jgi:serine/threonine-protein kinase
MSKVFTITEGLENMGALKTGGQGSIYKAKRTGPIITAVKLLPTPILSEDPADKHYRDFRNEVEKLKKVNETPNPNVVRILNFGISETGSFPFIEMEFIEGPDLEELLRPPHEPVFTIKETIRVAEHLSHALAHCHRVDVKHGDIKSNNIKFNVHTGNYVLLDFGLAVMSDEQRRTSLRHAGAIEFMAPEQSDGHTMFQTDVYSFGIILYELLAGQVPFPLEHKNETARNMVLVAHMETPPPDILPLRAANLPSDWPEDRRMHEMQVPQWLLDMIRKCLEKDPLKRFANGTEVYEFILRHSTTTADSSDLTVLLQQENKKLKEENSQLKSRLAAAPVPTIPVSSNPAQAGSPVYTAPASTNNSRKLILPIALASVIGLVILFFVLRANRGNDAGPGTDTVDSSSSVKQTARPLPQPKNNTSPTYHDTVVIRSQSSPAVADQQTDQQSSDQPAANEGEAQQPTESVPLKVGTRYRVSSPRAYFHNQPDRDTRRDAYLTPSDEVMTAVDEDGDFVYIVFTNDQGQTSKGWVLKRDLKPAD